MTALARLLPAIVLAAGWMVLTAAPVAAGDPGLTYDQLRTGRLVLGVVGLTVLAFIAWRALRGRVRGGVRGRPGRRDDR